MDKHVCRKSDVCCCYSLALEPNEKCPLHGYPWPPRCGECGRFMRWPPRDGPQWGQLADMAEQNA